MTSSSIASKGDVSRKQAAKPHVERKATAPTAAVVKSTERMKQRGVAYRASKGIGDFILQVSYASPLEIVEIERKGVPATFFKELSKTMEIPAGRIFHIVGLPKATVSRKVSSGGVIAGSGGQAAIGMAKLIAKAQEIAANSTEKDAAGFDAAKWLGKWIERPQPALGGRPPADLLDTPTGLEIVTKLLGAMESGAYL